MEVTTSDPAESQTMIIDQMSKYYGNADGQSFCNFDIDIEPTSLPAWIDINDNIVTIEADTELDTSDDETLTITVSSDGSV